MSNSLILWRYQGRAYSERRPSWILTKLKDLCMGHLTGPLSHSAMTPKARP